MSNKNRAREQIRAPETNIQVLHRLLHRGGHVIVAGGTIKDLPQRYLEHPQVLVWDDNDQEFAHKTIPTNTRGIVYNRWISHSNAHRLRDAAKQLGIPVFPLLRRREVLEILDSITSAEVTPMPDAPDPIITATPTPIDTIEETLPERRGHGFTSGYDESVDVIPPVELEPIDERTNEVVMRKVRRGEMFKEILPKHYVVGEMPEAAVARLQPILKSEYQIQMTKIALKQALWKYKHDHLKQHVQRVKKEAKVREKKKGTWGGARVKKVTETPSPTIVSDALNDFVEGERLLRDARAAIDLFLDYLPKLRKHQADLTSRQAKIRELLGD
jgi:hypothetical protein